MLYLKQGKILTCSYRFRLAMTLQDIQTDVSQDGGGQVVLETQADSLRQYFTGFSRQLLGFMFPLLHNKETQIKIRAVTDYKDISNATKGRSIMLIKSRCCKFWPSY